MTEKYIVTKFFEKNWYLHMMLYNLLQFQIWDKNEFCNESISIVITDLITDTLRNDT